MNNREITSNWFRALRDEICDKCQAIENEFAAKNDLSTIPFARTNWDRSNGGGGEISLLRGNVFEKMGVNISTVFGEFTEAMRKEIPGAIDDPRFFATGISLVAHMKSPLIPAFHFNTRYIETTKTWFGGGGDLTPLFPEGTETEVFHGVFKEACDKHNADYYPKFKKNCDDYFYLPHRKEPRGVGGIFYDYLNTGDFDADFAFTKDVGIAMSNIIPLIVQPKLYDPWTLEQKDAQRVKRGRYVEFNLLYDRGTKFGLMTDGNTEAILMSLPPEVCW